MALQYIRRVIDYGESTNNQARLIFLDWEKAFDKVSHHWLFISMSRLNIAPHYINVIKSLYNQPTFL